MNKILFVSNTVKLRKGIYIENTNHCSTRLHEYVCDFSSILLAHRALGLPSKSIFVNCPSVKDLW
jgi:hypothetical protein